MDSSSKAGWSIAWEVSRRAHIPGLLALLGVLRESYLKGQEFTEEKVLAWVASTVWHSLPLFRTLVEGRRGQKGQEIWTGGVGMCVRGSCSAKDVWYVLGAGCRV